MAISSVKGNVGGSVYQQRKSNTKSNKSRSTFEDVKKAAEEEKEDNRTNSQKIADYIDETIEKIKNGENETSIPIGSCSFTEKEWKALLKKFDILEESIRESAKAELKRRLKNKEYQENLKKDHNFSDNSLMDLLSGDVNNNNILSEIFENSDISADMADTLLTAQSVISRFGAEETGSSNIMYITWYTQEGIFCRQAGQSTGYVWSIKFTVSGQYDKVMDFLNKFDPKDNLKFASNENFWNDFLEEKIDGNEFFEYFQNMKNKVNEYWSKYFIPKTEL